MAISFNNIPNNVLAPFFGIEFKSSGNNFPAPAFALLVGQKLSTGTAVNRSVTLVGDKEEESLFGRGSMLSNMVKAFKKNYPTSTPYVYALNDPAGGTKASATIAVTTATATVSETLRIEIGGYEFQVPVIVGQSNTTIKTAIQDAINANLDLPFEAVSLSTSSITVRFKHLGTIGNGITIKKLNSTTLVYTVANLASGSGTINLTGQESDIPENILFNFIGTPYADSTNLTFYSSLLSNISGNWGFLEDQYGIAVTIVSDTLVNLTSTALKNDEHTVVFAYPANGTNTPLYEVIASATAQLHFSLTSPPNMSNALTGTVLEGVKSDTTFSFADRNALYAYGYSPLRRNRNGDVEFDRVITTYLTDTNNVSDTTYKDVNTIAQLQYTARYYRNRMQARFGKTYINNETLELMRSEVSNILRELETLAVFEDVEDAIKNMVLERNATNPRRVDVRFTPTHVMPLLQTATQIESKI
jgi:phage tail sheath gpL-like